MACPWWFVIEVFTKFFGGANMRETPRKEHVSVELDLIDSTYCLGFPSQQNRELE
jgi:hypothetical protein